MSGTFDAHCETRPDSRPMPVWATKRRREPVSPERYAIRPEFRPLPGDIVIHKPRASVFFGTPLIAHLGTKASA